MVRRRSAAALQELALQAWILFLNTGRHSKHSAEQCPAALLAKVLQQSEKLMDATVVRIVTIGVKKGLGHVDVARELCNPIMVHQLIGSLSSHPYQLTHLGLRLQNSAHCLPLLIPAFCRMSSLETLLIQGAASDELLWALSQANPLLTSLDVSNSKAVSDEGIAHLIGLHGSIRNNVTSSLQSVNIWGCSVSTRGSIMILKHCQVLTSMLSEWTSEAVFLLHLQNFESLPLEQLFAEETELMENLHDALVNLCPKLRKVTIRRIRDVDLDIEGFLCGLNSLVGLSLTHFQCSYGKRLKLCPSSSLTQLHLNPLTNLVVDLIELCITCPSLKDLSLEGVFVSLESKEHLELSMAPRLEEVRIQTSPVLTGLNPDVLVWLGSYCPSLKILDVGSCERVTDVHLMNVLETGGLLQAETIRLSRANGLTDAILDFLIEKCSLLSTLILKAVNRKRLEELQKFRQKIHHLNIDIDLVIYGWRS